MRKTRLLAPALATALLSATGLAYASTQFKQTSNIKLTATRASKPTGLSVSLVATDPGAIQPQGLKTLTITLPASTKFNFKSKAIVQCKVSEAEVKIGACPAKSKIGSGSAIANGAPVLPTIPETVTAYAGKNQIILLLKPSGPAGQILVLSGKVSANKVTASVPVLNSGGLNIVITTLNLSVKKLGAGKQAFITAGRCTKGKFAVKTSFVYQTGASLTLPSSSACKG